MRLLGFDVETWGDEPTYGLQPFRAATGKARVTSYALSMFKAGEVVTGGKVLPSVDDLARFLQKARQRGVYITGWNTAFDAAWLIALGLRDLVYANKWLDGMLLCKHLTAIPTIRGRLPYDLKTAVADRWPEHAGYGEGIDFSDMSPAGIARRLHYNRLDARFTLGLGAEYLEKMDARMRRNAIIEAESIPLVAESMVNGVQIDSAAAIELGDKMEETRRVALVKLKLRQDCGSIDEAVLASPTKLRKVLFDEWKLPIINWTKPTERNPVGNPSTDKDTLTILGYEDERAKLIHQYRDAKNAKAKFCDALAASAAYNGDGASRPTPRIAGTYTGRMTYSSKTREGKTKGADALVDEFDEESW